MKPRFYICFSTLFFAHLSADSQKISKADKITLANLRTHVRTLAADTAGGREMGSAGESTTADYVISALNQSGARPKGDDNGWLQTITIDEGRQISTDAVFTVNDQPLTLTRDWFPLTCSPAGDVAGSPAIALQESGVPWFLDLKDLPEGETGSERELVSAIRARAASCAKKGATALIVYNSSARHADKLVFDPKDKPEPAVIPVLYLTHEAKKRYFRDESASSDLRIHISYTEKRRVGHNVVAWLDNGSPSTVVVATRYGSTTGQAAMIELARLLAGSKLKANNYLFVVFSGDGPARFGSAWFHSHPPIDLNTVNYMVDLDNLDGLNETTHLLQVSGYGSSSVWAPLWNAVKEKHYLSFSYDSSSVGDQAAFRQQHIPYLVFCTGSGQPERPVNAVNFPGELQVLKFIYGVVQAANTRGRIPPAP